MLRERAAPQKAKRAAGMKFDVALVHSASFKSEISSVIHSIDLPSSLSFMNTNDFSILCVQVPFGARPRFFIPPISGNQIRTALLDDVSPNVCAANVRRPVCIQQDRCRNCRAKSAHCCSVRCPQRMGVRAGLAVFSAGDSGLYSSPYESLQTKCVWAMSLFQNRRANAIGAK